MAMPQRDNNIEQIHRLEGLIAYAEEQKDWDEVERLKERLKRLLDKWHRIRHGKNIHRFLAALQGDVGLMIIWNPWHGCHKVNEGDL